MFGSIRITFVLGLSANVKPFLFSVMSRAATFCDLPISTHFDSRLARSCASLKWVLNSGLRTATPLLSGRLTLPCHTGVISVVLHDIPVNASLPYDLILGLDWL